MANLHISFKNDKYKKTRGGYSRLLDISCAHCGQHLCYYQKDGAGILKRMYLDRIRESNYAGLNNKPFKDVSQLVCRNCKQQIGTPIVYKKENRPAYRLFVGVITKKIVKAH